MKLLFGFCGFLLHLSINFVVGGLFNGIDYKLVVQNDDIITPCEESPNDFIDKMYDLSNVSVTYGGDEETLRIEGTLKYIGNVTVDRNVILDVQVFKKQRGQYMSTVYNFHRHDLCASLWNPAEIWYKFSVTIPEELRICPSHIGSTYELDFDTDLTMKNIPDRHAAGDYMAHVTITYGPMPNEFMCFEILGYIEKM